MVYRIPRDLPDDLYRLIIQKWVSPSLREEILNHRIVKLRNKYMEYTVVQGQEKAWSFFGHQVFYCVEQVNRLNRFNRLQETLTERFF
jgi:hypothetical protein